MKFIEQKQFWKGYVKYIIMSEYGSVQIEMFDKPQDVYGSTAYIFSLYVDESHRRNGVGTLLLKRAEEIARLNGHKYASLNFDESVTPIEVLERLYKSSGYQVMDSYSTTFLRKEI